MQQKVIAIDGPSASGKGTVAAQVAQHLGWRYLDSGALYRLSALKAMQAAVALDDETSLVKLIKALDLTEKMSEAEIRSEAVGLAASKIAKLQVVRDALLECQRSQATCAGLVADGRDMGSVVFPRAVLKVFLTASAEVRAKRRALQLGLAAAGEAYDKILRDIVKRDTEDADRKVAPLQKLPEAKLLDTSDMTVEEAVATVLLWYEKNKKRGKNRVE